MEKENMPMQEALYAIWKRASYAERKANPENASYGIANWNEQVRVIQQYGKGLEETLRYLYMKQPSYDDFVKWMIPTQYITPVADTFHTDVLTVEDLEFWEKNGYVIIKNAVTEDACTAAREAIWQHLDASITEPPSWYKPHPDKSGLMLVLYHHPALDANRKSPKIRRAYEQLYGTTNIYPSLDKVSFNPPETKDFVFMGSPLHWDVSLSLPIPFKLQGLLYLNDVAADSGAFHCVPGFHHLVGEWLNGLAPGTNPRDAALQQLKPVPVAGKAGDFIIWHQALPHCATPNNGTVPRMVQYLTYKPVNEEPDRDVWL